MPNSLQRFKILMSYDGTDYSGWQRLGHDKKTIQQTLEKMLSDFFDRPITVVGSGRTDAGVHALGQVAHFDAPLDNRRKERLRHALQCLVPKSIVVQDVWLAPRFFHAQRSAVKKTYKYRVVDAPQPNVFLSRYSHWVREPLDLDFLNKAASLLVGKQDFASFKTAGTPVTSTIREIFEARWERKKNFVIFTVTGNGFMKQMVRNLVGTMLDLQRKGLPVEEMSRILDAKDRRRALGTAVPQGLSLYKVYYPEVLDIDCHKI